MKRRFRGVAWNDKLEAVVGGFATVVVFVVGCLLYFPAATVMTLISLIEIWTGIEVLPGGPDGDWEVELYDCANEAVFGEDSFSVPYRGIPIHRIIDQAAA